MIAATGVSMILLGIAAVAILGRLTPAPLTLLWSEARLPRMTRSVAILGGSLVVFGIWILGHALNPSGPTRIPGPFETAFAAAGLLVDGGLIDIAASAGRVLLGFGAAAALSIALAMLFSLNSVWVNAYARPLSFIRYVPPTAFTALLVIYFGIGELYKTAVIFVGVFFFNFHMTMDILRDFDTKYVDLARLTGASFQHRQSVRWLFATTIIPASWPRLWDMLRINLSFAWTFLVVAEVVGAQYGLGKEMYLSQRFFRVEQVYACILLFGLIGMLSDEAMQWAKRVLFPWHDDAVSK